MPPASRSPGARARGHDVVVRPLSAPKDGWTLEDAVRLAKQGYRLEQVQRVTGWHPAQVRAAVAAAERAQRRTSVGREGR